MQTYELRTPRGNPAILSARDQTSDLAVIGSVFEGVTGSGLVDEYHLADFRTNGRFVDVGAHIGAVSVAVLLDNPEATAILVEPIPENVAVIKANLAQNGLAGRAAIIEGAVGTNRISYMFEGSETASTNRYIGNLNVLPQRGTKTIEVRRVTLADLLPCDAMKVDCEGGEWALLAEPDITRIGIIFGEYHGTPGAEGILARLGRTHRVSFASMAATTGNFAAVLR